MESFLQNLSTMEQAIEEHIPCDVAAMSVWQNMFCHQASNVIVQMFPMAQIITGLLVFPKIMTIGPNW